MEQIKQICSISGGRTSAYLASKMIEKFSKDNVDFIYTDTGAEHPKTYEYLRNIEKHLEITITCLRVKINPTLGQGNSYIQLPLSECKPDLRPFRDICGKYGTPYVHGAFCTRSMKLEVFQNYCNEHYGKGGYQTWLGIRVDEPKRLKPRDGVSYLADISDMDKQDIITYWKSQPFDLEIPEHLGNCVFCIKKGINKVALAARDEPEMAAQFIELIESKDVRVVDRRQQQGKIMYRGNMSLRGIISSYSGHTREEIAATIRGSKGEASGSCSESCEAMLCESPSLDESPSNSLTVRESDIKPVPVEPVKLSKPFLKWVGGKFLQLPDILPLLEGHQRLIEPFAGGGSIFLNAGLKTALINDNCSDLINTYQQLQENAHDIITRAFRLFQLYNGQEPYLRIRQKFNEGRYTPAERAAVFIYLNRHCFNGLMRYNGKGEFNVGFGKYDAPYFPLAELENFISCCDEIAFSCEDYSVVIEQAGAGDVVFCDPPYEPLPNKEGFTQYSNGTMFKMADQERLVKYALEAHQRGATIIITNSGADSIKELYRANGFDIREVSVKRGMSCRTGKKNKAKDIIAVKKSLIPF